jgi:hypothetical protein
MGMNEMQDWPQVEAELKKRLAAKRYPTRLWWIFRDDIFQSGQPPRIYYRRPARDNVLLAEKVFKKGRARGFVRVAAVARFGNRTAVTVWYPEQDAAGWKKGAWIKIRNPLPRGFWVPRLLWPLLRLTPTFRAYQRDGWTIGTRHWASQRE